MPYQSNLPIGGAIPVTVLKPGQGLSRELIYQVIQSFKERDDVYSSDFETNLVVQQVAGSVLGSFNLSLDSENRQIMYVDVSKSNYLPEGPCFLAGDGFHEAWKLYQDTTDSFFLPVIAGEDNT